MRVINEKRIEDHKTYFRFDDGSRMEVSFTCSKDGSGGHQHRHDFKLWPSADAETFVKFSQDDHPQHASALQDHMIINALDKRECGPENDPAIDPEMAAALKQAREDMREAMQAIATRIEMEVASANKAKRATTVAAIVYPIACTSFAASAIILIIMLFQHLGVI